MAKLYQEVYPFTTEMIAEYFSELDFKDKKVLTVGSSLDQAYNALLLGAKNIVVYDINENVKQFGKLKRKLILTTPRKKLYDEVLKIEEDPLSKDVLQKDLVYKINPYLKDDESYETLRRKLKEENRIIDVEWNKQKKVSYTVEIEIFANDRNGLLADIVQKINDSKAKLLGVNARATKERIAITEVTLEIDSLDSLNKIIRELRKVDSVYEVNRKK